MRRIFSKILPKNIKIYIIEHRYIFKVKRSSYKKKLTKLLKENNSELTIDNQKKWIKKLTKLAYSNPDYMNLGEEFAKANLSFLKKINILPNDSIIICAEKNDLIKLKEFIKHHRALGIDKFIIIDNGSNDGSVEWLLKQKDVLLLHTTDNFFSLRRVAWVNRIIAHFGDNRWYVVLDSDEFLVYNDCENKKIKNVFTYLENKKVYRARSLMLDMYADKNYYKNGKLEDFLNECVCFDIDGYTLKKDNKFINIKGGFRKRIFDINACLTKYPIIFFRKKDIYCRAHYPYPFKDNNIECNIILMHYKFLPGEMEKYKKIVKDGNYFNNSAEYKQYLSKMKNDEELDFVNKNACVYKSSSSLDKINIYKAIKWNDK